jgi:hypothetical protein
MDEKTPTTQPKTSDLQSGPQVIAGFLTTIGANGDLDKETVQAILSLYTSGKLTTNNLLKALELARAESKA